MEALRQDLLDMIAAANIYRRSRGQSPMTLEEIWRRVGPDLLAGLN